MIVSAGGFTPLALQTTDAQWRRLTRRYLRGDESRKIVGSPRRASVSKNEGTMKFYLIVIVIFFETSGGLNG
jgi:hypothetical protein